MRLPPVNRWLYFDLTACVKMLRLGGPEIFTHVLLIIVSVTATNVFQGSGIANACKSPLHRVFKVVTHKGDIDVCADLCSYRSD